MFSHTERVGKNCTVLEIILVLDKFPWCVQHLLLLSCYVFFMLCEIVLPDVLCFLYPILCNEERKKERMHVTSFIFIYCVCINRSVFADAVGDGGSWFKFLSLLAKAVCNNNQLSFALKHWCSCVCFLCVTLAVYQQSSWLYIYQIFRSIRHACFSLLKLQLKMCILWSMWQGFP